MKQIPKTTSQRATQVHGRRFQMSGCGSAATSHPRLSETAARPHRFDPPTIAAQKAVPRLASVLALDERLTNWANVSGGHRGDPRDAALIDAAWRRMRPEYQMLLRMHYIWHANRAFICRRLKIRHRPWHVFEDELKQAKTEMAETLEGGGKVELKAPGVSGSSPGALADQLIAYARWLSLVTGASPGGKIDGVLLQKNLDA